ncbi:glycosyltransferase [Henriciella sp. AS95]|uniref:glycosyltransferase n=1 Tax=Henriciella sp. AS95 TaxID=3135782 RepID=UPI00316EA3F1
MNFSKISGLLELVMLDCKVFARVDSSQLAQPLELAVGDVSLPFEPVGNAAQVDNFSWPVRLISESISENVAAHRDGHEVENGVECHVNHLFDWALSGGDTMQLMITERDRPLTINFGAPLKVDPSDRRHFFSAHVAAHRARCTLVVEMTDVGSGKTKTHRVVIDPTKRGGQLKAGYLAVNIPFAPGDAGSLVQVTTDYEAYLEDGTGSEPWLFIADAQVSTTPNSKEQVLSPVQLIESDASASDEWLVAYMPTILTMADDVWIGAGADKQRLNLGADTTVEITENHGHMVAIRADDPGVFALLVDGQPAMRLTLTTEANFFSIPRAFLNGAIRQLAIADKSGTVRFRESQHLMSWILTPAEILQRETNPPFPTSIFPQSALRFDSLKAHIANNPKSADLEQLGYVMSVLEGGYERVQLKPLKFPKVSNPEVSVIIPAHNKVEVTYFALCSLLAAYNETTFEVIVVDDGSTDETVELETIVSGIKVIHNSEPLRFIRACNKGAEAARGKYIVLLNNDVEVTHTWLDELRAAFDRFPNAGLVGSKLLYPNGDLQDAGGIIWGSGNPWNFGNRANANEPRYSYARQADYLSGAAMMVPKKIWDKVDGLSNYLEPMYFEDTDFAFKVREAGYQTWFVPSSIVYHYEGMTSGTDTSSGFKRFQEVNRPKFKRRWAREFANFGQEGVRPDLEKDRGIVGRVLFVDYSTPLPDKDAGSYAAIQEIKLVQSLGYKVSFLPMNMAVLGNYTTELQKMGVEVIYAPFFMSPSEYLQQHAADFDAFYLTRYYVAREVIPHIRRHAPTARILFNNADLHFLRELRTARAENDSVRREAAKQIRDEEMSIIDQVDVVLSYNEVEHSVIEAYAESDVKVLKCPWTVEIAEDIPPVEGRKGLSFLGSFRHHPNAEGIEWFARTIMPRLSSSQPETTLSIYGSSMSSQIKALACENIEPVGFVEHVRDAFDPHRIFVAPLLSGAGLKGKVMSAMSHGIPCVLSPVAAEGIGLRNGYDCLIAESEEDWCTAIEKLNSDDALWNTISQNSLRYLEETYSFEKGRKQMLAAFETADLYLSVL